MNPIVNVLEQFGIDAAVVPHGNGHINNTFLVDSNPRVILQRINTGIFKNFYHTRHTFYRQMASLMISPIRPFDLLL